MAGKKQTTNCGLQIFACQKFQEIKDSSANVLINFVTDIFIRHQQ